jgi:5-methylcytosine-specific restriction endonuclease McrA
MTGMFPILKAVFAMPWSERDITDMGLPDDREQLQFLFKIQRLLGEGSFTASYKFALLNALADIAVEKGHDTGDPLWISIEDIAEKFIQYYWPQSAPYPSTGGSIRIIQQNTDRQAEIIRHIMEARTTADGSLAKHKLNKPGYRRLVKKVARVAEKMPLFKLQTLGREQVEFLYPNKIINKGIELLPGVSFSLRQFHLIIRDLIQTAWVRFVHRVRANQDILGQVKDLSEFLFGSERADLSAFTGILVDQQHGECFYCQKSLKNSLAVDHFIPWSRYPVDLGHNLVLTHQTCNLAKSDTLAGVSHLERWWDRNEKFGKDLSNIFDSRNLIHQLDATREICCWAYGMAETNGAQVWVARDQLEKLGLEWRAITGCS